MSRVKQAASRRALAIRTAQWKGFDETPDYLIKSTLKQSKPSKKVSGVADRSVTAASMAW